MKKLFLKSLAIGLLALLPAMSWADCEPITSFPITYGFETSGGFPTGVSSASSAPTTNPFGTCWLNTKSGTGTYSTRLWCTGTQYKKNGSQSLMLPDKGSGNITTLVFPPMSFTNINGYVISLWIYRNASGSSYLEEGVRVFISSTASTTDATELGFLYRNCAQTDGKQVKAETSPGWYKYEFSTTLSGTAYLIFQGESKYGSSTFIDDITISKAPTCFHPTELQLVGAATQTSANFSWTASGKGETQYQYVCVAKDATPDWSTASIVSATTAQATELKPSTSYDFYVRSYCDENDQSEAVKVTFRTACGTYSVLTYNEDFESYDAVSSVPSSFNMPCWDAFNYASSSPYACAWVSTSYAATGKGLTFRASIGKNILVVMPEFAENLKDYRIKFDTKFESEDETKGDLYIGYLTNPADQTTWSSIQKVPQTKAVTNNVVNLNAVPNGARLAFKYEIGYSYWDAGIDNISFEELPSCLAVSKLTVSNIGSSSVVLDWTNGQDETAWKVYYKESSSSTWSTKDVTAHPYTLTGLEANISYDVKVTAVCTEESEAVSSSFKTTCEPITITKESPFEEGFETDWSSFKDCWNRQTYTSGSYTYPYVYNSGAKSGSKLLIFYGGLSTSITMVVLPIFSNKLDTLQLEFWYKQNGTSSSNPQFIVGTMSDPSDFSTFHQMEALSRVSDYTHYAEPITLSDVAAQDKYIAIRFANGSSSTYGYLDDIKVGIIPTCTKPTGLQLVSDKLGADSAVISWTAGGTESAWQVRYKMSSESSWAVVDTTANPFTIKGLEPATNYDVQVCANCGAGDLSDWTESISFLTNCAAKATYQTNFDSETMSAMPSCWDVLNMTTTSDDPSAKVSNYFQSSSLTGRVLMFTSSTTKVGYAIMPELTDALNTYQITMSYRYTSYSGYGMMDLGYMTDGGTFVSLKQLTYSSSLTTIEDFVLNVPNEDASTARLAIRVGTGTTNSRQMYVDDINIQKIPTCKKISDVAASEPTAHGAKIAWTTAGADSTEIKVTALGATSAEAVAVFDTIVENTNKTAGQTNYAVIYSLDIEDNTQYKVWARGYCSSSDQGAWAKNYGTFKTLCDPFVASDLAMTDFEPLNALDCWTKDGAITSSTGEYYAGSQAYKLAKNNYLITPQLIAQMDTLQVSFYAKGSGNSGAQMDTLYVGVCEGTVATFDTIASLILTNGFQFYAVSLKEYTGEGKYIALLGQGENSNYIYACVDNLAITKAPDCGLPFGVGIKSQDYAVSTISWSGEANTYFYGVSTEPVAPANWDTYTGWIQSGEISAKEVVVTTDEYRQYYFYVKAICSATSSSWNKEGFAFKPACGRPMTMPFSENFNASTNIPDCWSTIAPASTYYSYVKVNSGVGVSSSNALEFQYKNYGSPVAIVLPVLDADIADCKLTFQLASSQYTSPSIYLDVVEDPSEITTSSLSTRTGITSFSQYGSFDEKSFDFSTYEGTLTGKYIILYQKSSSSYKAYIDNISIVKKLPRPSDVVITPSMNGASVTFKQKDPTGKWKWSIDGGVTTTAITDSAFQISGLDAATRYTLQIWHVGATEESAPYEEEFETLCEATIITDGVEYEETFDGTELPTCWKRVSNASNFVTISQEALYFQKSGIAFLPEFEFVDTTIQYCEMTFTQKSSYHPYKVIAVQDPSEITLANVNEKAFEVATMTTGDRFNEIYLDNVPEGYNYLGFYIPTDGSYISIDTLVVRVATLRVPTNLTASNVTDSSAVLTFNQDIADPAQGGWTYQYAKDANFTNPVEKSIADGPMTFTLKNLEEKTTYYVRVKQASDPVDNHWSNVESFTTDCGSLKFNPYVYTFDNMTVDAAPNCFTVGKGGSYATNPVVKAVSANDTAVVLNGYAYGTSNYSYFAMPLPADQNEDMALLTVNFKAKTSNASYKQLYVGVVKDFTSLSSFTGQKLINDLSTDYTNYSVSLDEYTGDGKYIVFMAKETQYKSTYYNLYVDNITITKATCKSPLPTVNNIKAHEVTLANGLTTGADWAWRFKDATTETQVEGATTSTTITGLEADSAYTIQVQARCAENDSSKWKDVSFRTMCDPLQGSDTILFENFDSGAFSTCWPMMENNKPTLNSSSSYTYQGSAYAVNVCNASAAAPKVMILQGITFTPGHYQISFYGKMFGSSAGTMKLALAQTAPTTVAEVNALSVVYSANVNTASYGDPYMYEFDQATTADMNVVLFMNGSGDIFIDNVLVYKTPCDKAESATSSDVTANSAVISIANEDPDWNVVVKNGNDVAFTQSNIQTASVTATGLNASTSYIAIITMNCGYATSDPDTINFTTTAAPETWDLIRDNLSANQVGTACQEKNITKVRGGVLYGVNYGTTASVEFVEMTLPIAAGEPLLFQADGSNDGKIEVVYGSSTATAPRCDEGKAGVRGFVGNLSSATSNINIAEGNILVSGGMLRLAGTGCYMGPGRAYIKKDELPNTPITPASAPGRRLVLTQNGTAVATGADEVMINNIEGVQKIVRDGQLIIIKGGKMYNAQGQVVK